MSLLGQRLRQEREARGLALLQVELDTRIRSNVIQALEEGDLDNLPPEPFLRGLIRSYANYLRIDPQEMLDLYAADTVPVAEPPPQSTFVKRPSAGARPPLTQPTARENPPAAPPIEPVVPTFRATAPPPAPEPFPAEPVRPAAPPSSPEPIFPRRRLPLAPPSPIPPKPVLPIKASMPPPSIPPETLPPPEILAPKAPVIEAVAQPATQIAPEPMTAPPEPKPITPTVMVPLDQPEFDLGPLGLGPEATRPGPMPGEIAGIPAQAVVLGIVAVIFGLLACGLFASTRIGPALSAIAALQATATPTRVPNTPTETAVPGATFTSIPTIAATAPPYVTVPGNPCPTPTVKATLAKTPEATGVTLNVDIAAIQPITVQIGTDGNLVFAGPIDPGTSRSWSANVSLYVRVQNFVGSSVTFNGKRQQALNFAERTLFVRQWAVNSAGRAIGVTPVAPSSGTSIPGASPTLTPTPTTARSTRAPAVPTSTATPTIKPASTKTPLRPTATLTPFS